MTSSQIRLPIELNYPQWRVHEVIADRRTVFFGFGRGVGKSHMLRTQWWLHVAAWDGKVREARKALTGVRIIVLMPTLVQFKDVHWSSIETELAGEWAFLGAKLDKQRGQITFPGGSWIKPFPASNYSSKAARGMRCDLLSGDEIDDIDAEVYDAVAIPSLSEPFSLGRELLGGTPTRGRHGLWYRLLQSGRLGDDLRNGAISPSQALELPATAAVREVFANLDESSWPPEVPRDPDEAAVHVLRSYYSIHATYRDAPETVSPLAVARAKATTLPSTFAREWEADPDSAEGIVYPFDEDFHVIGRRDCPHNELPKIFQEYGVGMDHGWVDPGCLLLGGITGHGEDATLWVIDESYESEIPNPEWDARALKWKALPARFGEEETPERQKLLVPFWPDPSRPDRINDLRASGINAREVDNEIFGGIARVAEFMFIRVSDITDREGNPNVGRWSRLYIHPRCRNLIRELGSYRRKKRADGTFDEQPEDKNNHSTDALRYLVVGRFGIRRHPVNIAVGGAKPRNRW